VADTSSFDVGDVVQVDSEFLLVTAISSGHTVPSPAATPARPPPRTATRRHAYLITNTRTGAEIDISAMSRTPVVVTQNCQTIQHAYQVGGALQSATNYVSGLGTPLDRDRMLAIQHCVDDFESALLYGKGVAWPRRRPRPMMKGSGPAHDQQRHEPDQRRGLQAVAT
jgi:hypothetical protein